MYSKEHHGVLVVDYYLLVDFQFLSFLLTTFVLFLFLGLQGVSLGVSATISRASDNGVNRVLMLHESLRDITASTVSCVQAIRT
jgi:hypothetical protein